MLMKKFAITGVAGFVAPRHLKAIKETNNVLIAALDPHDSVGILDSYFPTTNFFTDYERFERHLTKLQQKDSTKIDFLTVCSPNYLHDTHIRLGLNNGMNVICEKPLVINPGNLDVIEKIELQSGKKVYTVMQLRYHPSLIKLKNYFEENRSKKKFMVQLTYITYRGNWYFYSWKGDEKKSGGLVTNIGIHLFDLVIWLFGKVINSKVHLKEINKAAGILELENAYVSWYLSIDKNDLPEKVLRENKTTFRSIQIDGNEVEFSEGFTNLHTKVYEEILKGNGLGINDAKASIETVFNIRSAKISELKDFVHPFIKQR